MKKTIILFLIFLFTFNLFAQQDFKKEPKLYLKNGLSYYSSKGSLPFFKTIPFRSKINTSFVYQLHFEQYYSEKISLGWSISEQRFKYEQSDWVYTNNYNSSDTADLVFSLDRFNISAVTLFDWYRVDLLRLYSGVRVGITFWNSKSTVNNFKKAFFEDGYDVVPQIIAFGADFSFAEKIGGNIEVAIGPPYYFILGLYYKL